MSPDRRPVIAVIGGGISGLAAAWELVTGRDSPVGTDSPSVVILEADDRLGGKLQRTTFAGRTVDLAPDAFLARRPEATELCEELGISDELVPVGASGADVLARGRLRELPAGLNLGVPTRLWPLARSGILSWSELAGVTRDLMRLLPPEQVTADRAVGDIVGERMGRAVVDRLVDPLVGGINAGGVDHLSAAATFPQLVTASQQPGNLMRNLRTPSAGRAQESPSAGAIAAAGPTSGAAEAAGGVLGPVFWSLREGTASLVDRLVDRLSAWNVEVRTGTTVDGLSRDGDQWHLALSGPGDRCLTVDGAVLAIPAYGADALLAPHAALAAELLSTVEYASVAVVTMAFPRAALAGPLRGTGFLVPRGSTINDGAALMTGCTYLSEKWPHLDRPDDVLVRVSVGRFGDRRADRLSDEALGTAVVAELRSVLHLSTPPAEYIVTRWPDAFPQYRVGHLIKVSMIEGDIATVGAVAVAGAHLHGVGIPACIGSGRTAARAVLSALGSPDRRGSIR
ncbi:MAG: protoporphyrinogen oxidase [Acidimicrobiales bacterium]